MPTAGSQQAATGCSLPGFPGEAMAQTVPTPLRCNPVQLPHCSYRDACYAIPALQPHSSRAAPCLSHAALTQPLLSPSTAATQPQRRPRTAAHSTRPRGCHAAAVQPGGRHTAATQQAQPRCPHAAAYRHPCLSHAHATPTPLQRHPNVAAFPTPQPCSCHATALPPQCHSHPTPLHIAPTQSKRQVKAGGRLEEVLGGWRKNGERVGENAGGLDKGINPHPHICRPQRQTCCKLL